MNFSHPYNNAKFMLKLIMLFFPPHPTSISSRSVFEGFAEFE
jgi:hypothetical protein